MPKYVRQHEIVSQLSDNDRARFMETLTYPPRLSGRQIQDRYREVFVNGGAYGLLNEDQLRLCGL